MTTLSSTLVLMKQVTQRKSIVKLFSSTRNVLPSIVSPCSASKGGSWETRPRHTVSQACSEWGFRGFSGGSQAWNKKPLGLQDGMRFGKLTENSEEQKCVKALGEKELMIKHQKKSKENEYEPHIR